MGNLFGDGFDSDIDAHLVAHIRGVFTCTELGTLDGGKCVGTQHRHFHHGVRQGLEGSDGQGNGLGHAFDGELAFYGDGLVAF